MPTAPSALTPAEQTDRVLADLVTAARDSLGETLDAVILYGSAAEGRLRATSDVNVILVLGRFEAARVDALRDSVRLAQAAIRLAPMFLLREEIPHAAAAFAVKFADIARRHRVLYGNDPFTDLVIPRERLIARLTQVLLNLRLRLRAAYVTQSLFEDQLVGVITNSAGPLRSAAAALLELEGHPRIAPREALIRVVESLGDPELADAVAHISLAREHGVLPPGLPGPTVLALGDLAADARARTRLAIRGHESVRPAGPQFLGLYALFVSHFFSCCTGKRQPKPASQDASLSPIVLIAYLRGGASEAIRLCITVLIDRQLLDMHDVELLETHDGISAMHGANELERAILERCKRAQPAREIIDDSMLQQLAQRSYEPGLLRHGLLADQNVRAHRSQRAAFAVVALVAVAALKVAIGMARNRPVSFLIVSAASFSAVALLMTKGRRTVRGDRILADLKVLFDALRHRASELRPNARRVSWHF